MKRQSGGMFACKSVRTQGCGRPSEHGCHERLLHVNMAAASCIA